MNATPPAADCLVCGKNLMEEEFQCTDFFLSGEIFPIFRCRNCGFRMTGNLPSEDQSSSYYQSEEYISHSNTSQGIVSRMYHLVRQFTIRRKASILFRYSGKTKGSVLDIGAGTAFFLSYMARKGWQVAGTEPGEEARRVALTEQKVLLLSGEELFTLPGNSYDVITLWHVLEHIYHPEKYWNEFKRLLRPGGVLIIALPNPDSWDARHYREYWAAWDVPRHLWHFTPANLKMEASANNFNVRKIIRMPFDSFYVSILSEKYKKASLPIMKGVSNGARSWGNALINRDECSSLIYILEASKP